MLNLKKISFAGNPLKVWEIIISIYIIGLINIYNIHKYGLEGIYPINYYIQQSIGSSEIIENMEKIRNEIWNCVGIINLNEKNIINLIIINFIFLIIFNSNTYQFFPLKINSITSNSQIGQKIYGLKNIEFPIILGLGLLGLNILIITKDLILIFISIELYSISTYLLILLKINRNTTRISIVYLLINSISSYIFLLGIAILYKYTGSILIDEIKYILPQLHTPASTFRAGGMGYDTFMNTQQWYIIWDWENSIYLWGVLFLILGLLLKLGIVPFNFWVLRLYTQLEIRILLYQIIIPKLVFIYLLYQILNNFATINGSLIGFFYLLILFISILSVIIASIGGLFNTYYKSILTYSSILNMGFILLSISQQYQTENISSPAHFVLGQIGWGEGQCSWEYIFIYIINTIAFFFCLFLIYPTSKITSTETTKLINNNIKLSNSWVSLLLLFSIFSFIGIPPFAGFYGKLNIFINILYSYNPLWMISIIFLFISTFISACFYLKFILFFIFNSSSAQNVLVGGNTSTTPDSITYIFSLFSLFLLFYPFFSNFFYPFYIASFFQQSWI